MDQDDFSVNSKEGSSDENDLLYIDDLFMSSSYPTDLNGEKPRQASPIPAQVNLPLPASSPDKVSDEDEDEDDDEEAFKKAWDEALMPPPPQRPAPRQATPLEQIQIFQTPMKRSIKAQASLLKPSGSPTTTLEQPPAEAIKTHDTSLQQITLPLTSKEQSSGELPTEANSHVEKVSEPHALPGQPLTAQDVTGESAVRVKLLVYAPTGSGWTSHRREQAKKAVQKRELRMSTMAQRPDSVQRLRSGAIRRGQRAWWGLKNDRTETKMNDKGFSI